MGPYHQFYTPEERILFKTLLGVLGYQTDNETAIWDSQTDEAVRAFQRDHGLAPDGRIGPLTLEALSAALGGQGGATALRLQPTLGSGGNLYKGLARKPIGIGDIIKYFNFDVGEFRYAVVSSLSDVEATLYDWTRDESFQVRKDDIRIPKY